MFVELHILQNFAPSNLNRDDTNAPKDCEFGGFRRARISSQCLKRAIRWHPAMRDVLADAPLGMRSKLQADAIRKKLVELGKPTDKADAVVQFLLRRVGFKQRGEKTSVLLYMGSDEVERVAQELVTHWDNILRVADVDQLWEDCAGTLARILADNEKPPIADRAEQLARLVIFAKAGGKKPNGKTLHSLAAFGPAHWLPVITAFEGMTETELAKIDAGFTTAVPEDADVEDTEPQKVPDEALKAFKKVRKVTDALKDLKLDDVDEDAASENEELVKQIKSSIGKVLKTFCESGTTATDIALFGRMVAEVKKEAMKVNAASQVAHAISTNKVEMEFDFFTAVDDLQQDGATGAGMMGTFEFNSSCFYRYLNVDFTQLAENLGKDGEQDVGLALRTVEGYIRAAVEAIPTGKQFSTAPQNPPSFVFAVVRNNGLWSLANAFVKPVWPKKDEDLVSASIGRLDTYWQQLVENYGAGAVQAKAVMTMHDEALANLKDGRLTGNGDKSALDAVVATVLAALGSGGQS